MAPFLKVRFSALVVQIFHVYKNKGLLLLFLLLGSGLSSSAAFVCSATIAIMGILEKNFPKVLLNASKIL